MAGKFELKVSSNGKYHFNLKAGNGQIILSSEMYESSGAYQQYQNRLGFGVFYPLFHRRLYQH